LIIIDKILRYLGYRKAVSRIIDTRGVKSTSDHLCHNLNFASKAYAPPTQYEDIKGCKPEDEVSANMTDSDILRLKSPDLVEIAQTTSYKTNGILTKVVSSP